MNFNEIKLPVDFRALSKKKLLKYCQQNGRPMLFIERKNTNVKIFGPKTWCTKSLSVIEFHTTWIPLNIFMPKSLNIRKELSAMCPHFRSLYF